MSLPDLKVSDTASVSAAATKDLGCHRLQGVHRACSSQDRETVKVDRW